ncbi:MAG TPA: hypothetical protein VL485_16995 [Ktedonobacteraceae bacterium]|jgi:hypothetical protein|nr:hypothetical protein [Ktedonobacteraceae bacterium]
MSQASQFSEAITELQDAVKKCTEAGQNLGYTIGYVSSIVYALNQVNDGKYIEAAVRSWQAGARDGYRTIDALDTLVAAMQTLAHGLESHTSAIQNYEGQVQNQASAPLSLTQVNAQQQYNSSVSAISALVSAFNSTVDGVTPSVNGGCSAATDPLKPGQTDGTNVPPGGGTPPGGGGGGDGTPPGDDGDSSWWNKWWNWAKQYWQNQCSGDISGDTTMAFKDWLSSLTKTKAGRQELSGLLASTPIITLLYSSQYILTLGMGLNKTVVEGMVNGTISSLFDGPPLMAIARHIPVGSGFKLAQCPTPMALTAAVAGGLVADNILALAETKAPGLWKKVTSSGSSSSDETPTPTTSGGKAAGEFPEESDTMPSPSPESSSQSPTPENGPTPSPSPGPAPVAPR